MEYLRSVAMNKKGFLAILAILFLVVYFGINDDGKSDNLKAFKIISGSENKALEPILVEFGKQNGYSVHVKYKGSVDIMNVLKSGASDYDGVWAANSLWYALGDKNHIIKYSKSIITSPVVFGIKKSIAKKLGFVGKDVYVKDILDKINKKELKFTMTSATQSNSGATSYFGFLYALMQNPDIITLKDLKNPILKEKITKLLSGVDRSSGSSGWLKELFLKGGYDAMVNYEAMLIEANNELEKRGEEPLYAIYPKDGLALADSPLGYINHGDKDKETFFLELQKHLLSKDVQDRMISMGRRSGMGGLFVDYDTKVFKPEWGVDTKKILNYIKMPNSDVILEALNMYQQDFRKPSFTIFALDYSGSMGGEPEKELKEAMNLLLSHRAKEYFLQPTKDDKTILIGFNSDVVLTLQTTPDDYLNAYNKIAQLQANGGTNIYNAAIAGLEKIAQNSDILDKYNIAIILMTDGESDMDNQEKFFRLQKELVRRIKKDIPVFSIMFGNANASQLNKIAQDTKARVFNGKKDLVKAFKKAKGYN